MYFGRIENFVYGDINQQRALVTTPTPNSRYTRDNNIVTVIPNGNIFNIHANQLDPKPGKHYQIIV